MIILMMINISNPMSYCFYFFFFYIICLILCISDSGNTTTNHSRTAGGWRLGCIYRIIEGRVGILDGPACFGES
jgi:hypothetical protein